VPYLAQNNKFQCLSVVFKLLHNKLLSILLLAGFNREGKALAEPTLAEKKIERQLEQIPPGERMLGMAVSPVYEGGLLKTATTGGNVTTKIFSSSRKIFRWFIWWRLKI
jgi:hypothetical protein